MKSIQKYVPKYIPKYILGIDEVGRGPVAGPITFCAFIMPESTTLLLDGEKLKDSKKMTDKMRREKSTHLNKQKMLGNCDFMIVSHQAKEIEKIGLSNVINKCLERCVTNIIRLNYNLDKSHCSIKLDGSLKFRKEFVEKIKNKYGYELDIETVVKGDEKVEAISSASIKAKVTRDVYMQHLNKKIYHLTGKYYGWDKNVGYGTKEHMELIKKYGFTEYHRKSWIKNI